MLEHALAYAARGWRVLPLRRQHKAPATANGFKDATTDEEQIRRWWAMWPNANVGIAVGPHSNLFVLDVDGVAGHAALKHLGYEVPETYTVKTGKGCHYYFLHPLIDGLGRKIRVLDDIDVLPGDGYIVAPPSIHPDGGVYECENDEVPVAEAPEWLCNLARQSAPQRERTRSQQSGDQMFGEGERDNALASYAGKLRAIGGLSASEIEIALGIFNESRCSPPLPDEDVRRVAASIARYDTSAGGVEVAPAWMMSIMREKMVDLAGDTPAVTQALRAVETEQAKRREAAEADGLGLRLTRRTAGVGLGGVYDAEVIWKGRIIPLSDLAASALLSYGKIRGLALSEGVWLPSGKGTAKTWDDLVQAALADDRVTEVERSSMDDPLTACIEVAEAWFAGLEETSEPSEVAGGMDVYMRRENDIIFSGRKLYGHIQANVPDAKRSHIASAMRSLGVDNKSTIQYAGSKRAQVRTVPEHVLQIDKLRTKTGSM